MFYSGVTVMYCQPSGIAPPLLSADLYRMNLACALSRKPEAELGMFRLLLLSEATREVG